jgi:PAS domain S-box-containing protein
VKKSFRADVESVDSPAESSPRTAGDIRMARGSGHGGGSEIPLWAGLPMAAALVVATLLLRVYFYQGHEPLLIFFILPVILSAVLGGLVPGLVATLLAFVLSYYFLLEPLHKLAVLKPDDHFQWGALLVIGVTVVLMVEALHRSGRRREKGRRLIAVTLGSIGDAVIVTDRRGRITFINAEAERLTGWVRAEARGQRLANVFRIADQRTRQPLESPFDRVLRKGSAVGLEDHTVLIARDGKDVIVDDSAAPVRLKDGTMEGIVVVFRDFTERKKVKERMEHLASFPELNPDPIVEVDAAGRVTFCNPAATRTMEDLGMDKEDCAGLLPKDLGTILGDWDKKQESTLLRKVTIVDRVFEETIHLVPQFGVVRIYARETTRRRTQSPRP